MRYSKVCNENKKKKIKLKAEVFSVKKLNLKKNKNK